MFLFSPRLFKPWARAAPPTPIGDIAKTQEMLDSCGKHNITSVVEVIPIQKVNDAYERMMNSDVQYCFSIDIASLKLEKPRPTQPSQ